MPFSVRCFLAALGLLAASSAAEFPTPFNSGGNPARSPLSPAQSAAALKLPSGFRATVFAAEPDVQNPIGMAWDAHGRLWIAENYTYAERGTKFELGLRDRVLVFDGATGERFRSRRVFVDDVQRLTSVEVGYGGVWLMCPPQLLFVPDRNEDGVPDGGAEVVLDGFTIPPENYHNFANGLRFGPEGWLYGRCGASSPGEIGPPGSVRDARVPMRGTLWRYHPVHKIFEALSSGTTNPWGHDWDARGELFFINTVNGHLWHGIAGAHYQRPHTLDPNPHVYELIDMHADHWHFDTAMEWQKSRDGAANSHGGGHAHSGVMIYQGDNWPPAYRDRLYTLNFHGRRVNQEILERRGSGYVGRHGVDFFVSEDTWFRGIDLGSGPDGGVFVLDWSDTGECHNATGVSRTSGRIYKITHGEAKAEVSGDLAEMGGRNLAALQASRNDWFARQSRLQLATRVTQGHALTHAKEDLRATFAKNADTVTKLRALWTLHAVGDASPDFLHEQLGHADEHVRAWAIRLLTDRWPLDTPASQRPRRPAPAAEPGLLSALVRLAASDSSPLVRLTLASTLQRLEPPDRVTLASALVRRAEDAADHNLPLMIWYGLIPVAEALPAALAGIAGHCELPVTRRLIARRLAEEIERTPAPVNELIAVAGKRTMAFQADIVAGLAEGLTGWQRAPKPAGWDALAATIAGGTETPLQARVRELSLLFGDGRALDDVKAIALNPRADLAARRAALRALIEKRPPDLRNICAQVMRVRFLNSVAARGLALFDDPAVGEQLARAYSSFHHSERGALIETLVSRPVFAKALLTEVAAGRIPRGDVTPFHARQMRSLNDADLTKQLAAAWGELREPRADKASLFSQLKAEFAPEALTKASKSRGRVVFANACASCHRLYGEGGQIGPDLTGSGRDNLDYLIENIADPGAVVTADYRLVTVKMKDGRSLGGFIAARTARTLTVRSITDSQTVERAEIAGIEESNQSMMPEGLLEALTPEQRRDLIAYLKHPAQVPLP